MSLITGGIHNVTCLTVKRQEQPLPGGSYTTDLVIETENGTVIDICLFTAQPLTIEPKTYPVPAPGAKP